MTKLTSLYIAPENPYAAPSRTAVLKTLTALDIIGPPLADHTFSAGDGFARHIVFAGCSPHLSMQPAHDSDLQFCHVAVHGPFRHARLVTGPNTVKPRCAHCRARFDDWRDHLNEWKNGEPAHCANCGSDTPAPQLDWRGHAIGAGMLIELRNVFPGEATPSDVLLDALEDATGMAWRYAWAEYFPD